MRLEEFARYNDLGPKAQLNGLASARLYLAGQGSGLAGLAGGGSIDVPKGKMANLPLLLDLLKVLSLRLPDRTAFEEAHVRFDIAGPRVKISRLDLFGNAISLSGQGEMNLDGSDIQLDFYAVWARILDLLPPVMKKIPIEISEQLLKIEMRGRLGQVRVEKKPVPVLVEPLRQMLTRMREWRR
jgi:hypothetical protein